MMPDANFSGPVSIPKLYNGKNKTFFFFGFQRLHEKKVAQVDSGVPSLAMRQGDFDVAAYNRIFDPATTAANRTPVFLSLPLMFCFAPSVLVLLMSPTLLQLNEFFNPKDGNSTLSGNEAVSMQNITRSLNGLDQDVSVNGPAERTNTRSQRGR